MDPILQDLDIVKGDVVTIVGTGGKTTLLFHLAELLSKTLRVLVTTTTKIMVPDEGSYDVFYPSMDALKEHLPQVQSLTTGIIVAGSDVRPPGKLIGLKADDILSLLPYFDVVIIEGDGSRGKKLKAWASHEPVVPSMTTKTIGVLPITALGLPLTEENIHNLELFPLLTGLEPPNPATLVAEEALAGQSATMAVLKEVVLSDLGLFKDSHGERILLINQADTAELEALGRSFTDLVEAEDRDHLIKTYLILSLEESRHGNHRHYSSRRPRETDAGRQAPSGT